MRLQITNIGLIKEADIFLDGLTVITGDNNSGKSTVGKVIYSLFAATSDLQNNSQFDKRLFAIRILNSLSSYELSFFRKEVSYENERKTKMKKYPQMKILISREWEKYSMSQLEEFSFDLKNELEMVLEERQDKQNNKGFDKNRSVVDLFAGVGLIELKSYYENELETAIKILEKLIDDLQNDQDLTAYARESINQHLQKEFYGQIQSLSRPSSVSRIKLSEDGQNGFDLSLRSNKVVDEKKPVYSPLKYRKVYFIDTDKVMDAEYGMETEAVSFVSDKNESWLTPNRVYRHDVHLYNVLHKSAETSIFESVINKEKYADVTKLLSSVMEGKFEFSADGEYYLSGKNKVKIGNLATGSKMISIFKILVEKGLLDESTVLILDEPEAHLHPKWQNVLAEIIVVLVKELNVNVLLASHSSNFVLAIDAYMRKYGINDKTNFYRTIFKSNGSVGYECMNEDLGMIYQDFVGALEDVNTLRNKYLTPEEE